MFIIKKPPEVLEQFVSYVNHHAQREGLLPLDQGGMARLVEEASREVSHQNRLSAQVSWEATVLLSTVDDSGVCW